MLNGGGNVICHVIYLKTSFTINITIILIDLINIFFLFCYCYYDGVYGYQSINQLISIMTMVSHINKKTS